jgi:hypothetical protein
VRLFAFTPIIALNAGSNFEHMGFAQMNSKVYFDVSNAMNVFSMEDFLA